MKKLNELLEQAYDLNKFIEQAKSAEGLTLKIPTSMLIGSSGSRKAKNVIFIKILKMRKKNSEIKIVADDSTMNVRADTEHLKYSILKGMGEMK